MVNRKILAPIILAVALVVGCDGCKSGGGFPWPSVVSCGSPVGELVGTVTQILISDLGQTDDGQGIMSPDGKKKLEGLATQYGADTVLCLVSTLIRDWRAPAASPNPQRFMAAARGEDFIRSTGSKIEPKP